ncbi:HSP20-like chaperone [Choiromyces venosus 120613-1]|uniref:HSP20-like chaperone n=1 Tax=Choiromyces venosus 120613-1 TaxID=1336337 RepID=A0A3N4K8A6_9PEZI|nr:HSP20-like chaperone [Choiromyces venosus 120613-1]
MAFFSRFVHPAPERELLRALCEFPGPSRRITFSPNFDVCETESSYILEGELPGLHDKSKLNIEFTDPQTLFIKGRLDKSHENHPESHKARVEDVSDERQDKEGSKEVEAKGKSTDIEAKKESKPKLWISERTSGEFQRSFTFPINIDQEGVKASLEHGILRILVPKSHQPVGRRIEIQ